MKKDSKPMEAIKSHWTVPMKENIPRDTKEVIGCAFDPQPARMRKKTYNPINDQDN